jgi:hypothetical protein
MTGLCSRQRRKRGETGRLQAWGRKGGDEGEPPLRAPYPAVSALSGWAGYRKIIGHCLRGARCLERRHCLQGAQRKGRKCEREKARCRPVGGATYPRMELLPIQGPEANGAIARGRQQAVLRKPQHAPDEPVQAGAHSHKHEPTHPHAVGLEAAVFLAFAGGGQGRLRRLTPRGPGSRPG